MKTSRLVFTLIFAGLFVFSPVVGAGEEPPLTPCRPVEEASNQRVCKKAPQEWVDILDYYTRENILPGVGVLIKSPNWGVRFFSSGKPNLSKPEEKFLPTTQFRIGSCTKAFMSNVILQQEYEHKLRLNQTINEALPKDVSSIIQNGDRINLESCLDMTSGLWSYTELPKFSDPTEDNALDEYTPLQLMQEAMRDGYPAFDPANAKDGEHYHYSYSNSGYTLVGILAEQLDGKKLPEIFKERIFDRLGMHDTFLATEPWITSRMAHGYTAFYETGAWQDCSIYTMTVPWSAGAVISTPFDLLAFYEDIFKGGKVLHNCSKQKFLRMNCAQEDGHKGYGKAILEEMSGVTPAYGHGGTVLGFLTLILYVPEADFYYISFFNTWDNKFTRGEIFERIAHIILASTAEPTPGDDSKAKLNNEGEVTLSWQAGYQYGTDHRVYIGTDEKAVEEASFEKHDGVTLDVVVGYEIKKKELIPGKTYYWRVDARRVRPVQEIEDEQKVINDLVGNENSYTNRLPKDVEIIPGPTWKFTVER